MHHATWHTHDYGTWWNVIHYNRSGSNDAPAPKSYSLETYGVRSNEHIVLDPDLLLTRNGSRPLACRKCMEIAVIYVCPWADQTSASYRYTRTFTYDCNTIVKMSAFAEADHRLWRSGFHVGIAIEKAGAVGPAERHFIGKANHAGAGEDDWGDKSWLTLD
jgi:hypothetical protein